MADILPGSLSGDGLLANNTSYGDLCLLRLVRTDASAPSISEFVSNSLKASSSILFECLPGWCFVR